MTEAPVPDVVRDALLRRSGPLWNALEIVVAWEAGAWERVGAAAAVLNVPLDDLPDWYAEALDFADAVRSAEHPHSDPATTPADAGGLRHAPSGSRAPAVR